jgi:proteasome accessory factor A
VGSHPEYATAECDNLSDLIKQDQAGDRIVEELAVSAEIRLNAEGIKGQIHLFKNNMDAAGNSYGCHENFSVSRKKNFEEVTESIIPFLITRQIFCGAGKWISSSKGANFQISQRAEHMWESVSSATTRSRPIINTRDEPHADPDEYRRLHIIVGDSNMSETTTVVKVATTELMLRAAELGLLKDKFTIENPIRTIREISTDLKFRNSFRLSSGREITALQMQNEMYNIVSSMPGLDELLEKPFYRYALNLWRRSLDALESEDYSLVDMELDWMIKRKFMNSYKEKHQLNDMDSRLILLDISYHNIRKDRGLFYILEKSGMAKTLITNNDVNSAMENPPETTRAALRGRFIKVAQEKKRDFTVDWVNLKINDQQQSSIACKDPFKNIDERVDKLIAAL